jgi:hypothetical protein
VKKINPVEPVRADYRKMLLLLREHKDKFDPTPEELEKLSRVFVRFGGSWEALSKGDPSQVVKLRKVLNVACDQGYISKKKDWK